jgi:hypothetical protein
MKVTILYGAAIWALSGCSSYSLRDAPVPPVVALGPEPRADVATVCVVRPSHLALAVTFVVHDNGQLVGATRAESYFCYWAEPGQHQLVSGTGDPIDHDGQAVLAAEAGKRYWLHQDFDNVFGVISDKLLWIDERRARQMLEEDECQYKTLSGVPGDEKLPPPVPLAVAR